MRPNLTSRPHPWFPFQVFDGGVAAGLEQPCKHFRMAAQSGVVHGRAALVVGRVGVSARRQQCGHLHDLCVAAPTPAPVEAGVEQLLVEAGGGLLHVFATQVSCPMGNVSRR